MTFQKNKVLATTYFLLIPVDSAVVAYQHECDDYDYMHQQKISRGK